MALLIAFGAQLSLTGLIGPRILAIAPPTVYVASSGLSGTGGSCATPDFGPGSFGTGAEGALEAAVAAVATPGTVHLCAGTFSLTTGEVDVNRTGLTFEGDDTTDSGATVVSGGGLFRLFDASAATVVAFRDMTLRDGSAGSALGGAIDAQGLSLVGVTLERNRGAQGGAVYATGPVSISGSTFHANSSPNAGGGIRVDAANVVVSVTNSTFVDNTAGSVGSVGGAILVYTASGSATLEVTGSTFVRNIAGDFFGAHVGVMAGTSATFSARSSIFSGDGNPGCFISPSAAPADGGGNFSASASGCPGTSSSNLRLQPLADNGGPTKTVALGAGSDAIDATMPSAGLCPLPVDQRGIARPAGLKCDSGAYEYQWPSTTTTRATPKSIAFGASVDDVATVQGAAPDGAAFIDPTAGSVTFWACNSRVAAPTSCLRDAAGAELLATVLMTADPTAGDGIATATLDDWTPSRAGYWLISAAYSSRGGTYADSSTTGDVTNELVYVRDETQPLIQVKATTPADATTGVNKPFSVRFSASDGTTGGSDITGGSFTLDGGTTWSPGVPLTGWGSVAVDFSTGVLPAPNGPGPVTVCGKATDASGNTSAQDCTTFTIVDDARPSIRVSATDPADRTSGVPYRFSVTFAASDGTTGGGTLSGGEVSVDGGSTWTSVAAPLDETWDEPAEDFSTGVLTDDSSGARTICGRATDLSGNTSLPDCTTFTLVDDTAPTVVVVSPESPAALVYGDDIAIHFSASDGTTGGSRITAARYRIARSGSAVGSWTTGIPAPGGTSVTHDFSTGVLVDLSVGTYAICGDATDASGNTSQTSGDSCATVEVTAATPVVYYAGQTYTDGTGSVTLQAAFVDGLQPAICFVGSARVDFVASKVGSLATSSGSATSGDGFRILRSLSEGIWTVDVHYVPSDPNCAPSNDDAVITVFKEDGMSMASGAGWYKIGNGAGSRMNFGFSVKKVSNGGRLATYAGHLVWTNKGVYRLRGTVTTTSDSIPGYATFTCPTGAGLQLVACGSIRGYGSLEEWSAETSTWIPSTDFSPDGIVTFTATVYDGGDDSCFRNGRERNCPKKGNPDYFGIQFDQAPSDAIRESLPVELDPPSGNGSVKIY